jgi:hypothetical protein
LFAALAGFVFWGTWSPDVTPVMPDAEMSYPADRVYRCLRYAFESGRFQPFDIFNLLVDPYRLQELRYVVSLYLAALGMVYFCRGRSLGRLASYGAGLLLGFCGYWMTLYSAGHFGWFLWMAYGVFAFGLADRAVRKGKPKSWLLLGATVSWAGFNQQDLWLLFTVFTALYFVWCCIRERRFPWKGVLVSAAVFVLVGIPNFREVISGTLQGRKEQIARNENVTGKSASQQERNWEFVTNWSMPPEDALEFFIPRVHGDTSCPFVLSIGARNGSGVKPYSGRLGRPMNAAAGNYRQHSLYVGYVTCALALVSLAAFMRRRESCAWRRDLAFFAVAAAVFFSLSLGRFFEPAYRMVFALPFGNLIRCPVKWHHLTEFCLVFMAACGIELLVRRARASRWRPKGVNVALALVAALVVWGAVDLAVEDRRYCAPVDVGAARRTGSSFQFAVLSRNDFANPQVAQMVRAGQVVSVASYLGSRDHYLVGVLSRFNPYVRKDTPLFAAVFGIVSLLATLGVSAYALKSSLRR